MAPQSLFRCSFLKKSSGDSNNNNNDDNHTNKCGFECPYTDLDRLLSHLRTDHHVSVQEPSKLIYFMNEYLSYWADKLGDCTGATLQKNGEGEDGIDFVLGKHPYEDSSLRNKLHTDKLKEVIEVNQQERADQNFCRKCLFCHHFFANVNRSEYLLHMKNIHNFIPGLPDNLVYVNDFLDHLQQKLDSLLCIYCEKKFKNHEVLRQHMRKKKHVKIKPRNREYDCYYLVNYLEPGKNWEDLDTEVDTDSDDSDSDGTDSSNCYSGERGHRHRHHHHHNAEDDTDNDKEDDDTDEWVECDDQEIEDGEAQCLFCEQVLKNPAEARNHMFEDHNKFTIESLIAPAQKHPNIGKFYAMVRGINYIRRRISSRQCVFCDEAKHTGGFESRAALLEHMATQDHFCVPEDADCWTDPQYLIPHMDNDSLLFSLEMDDDDDDDDGIEIVASDGDSYQQEEQLLFD